MTPHPDSPPCSVKACERLTEKVFSHGMPAFQYRVCEFHHLLLSQPDARWHDEDGVIVFDVGAAPDLIDWEFSVRRGSAGATVTLHVRDRSVNEVQRFRATREQLQEFARRFA